MAEQLWRQCPDCPGDGEWVERPDMAGGTGPCLTCSGTGFVQVAAGALLIEDGLEAAARRVRPLIDRLILILGKEGQSGGESSIEDCLAVVRAAVGEGDR